MVALPGRISDDEDQRDAAVSRMSQMLMQGWTMLADHCPACTTVLMRHRQHGTFCVTCRMTCLSEPEAEGLRQASARVGSISDERCEEGCHDDDDDWQPPTAEERRRIQERLDERDRISELMAAKMLAGWAMLNEHCSVCNIPLLRDPKKGPCCVCCDNNVGSDQADTRASPSQEAVAEDLAHEPVTSAPQPTPSASIAKPLTNVKAIDSTIVPQPNDGIGSVLADSRQTLLVKMSLLNSRMNDATETGSILHLANAMESVARAIAALSNYSIS